MDEATMNLMNLGKGAAIDPSWIREDGTPKGQGYFGQLPALGGKTSTELSIGVNFDGQEMDIPSLVPGLSPEEINHMLSGGQPTPEIMRKAVEHARGRIASGLDPFAGQGEQRPSPTEYPGQSMPSETGGYPIPMTSDEDIQAYLMNLGKTVPNISDLAPILSTKGLKSMRQQ